MSERRIDWMAISMGALTDLVGTALFVSLLGVVAAFAADMQHVPVSEMEARLRRPGSMISMMLIGLAFTVLGGFVAGRVAKTRQVLHGGIVGSLGVVLALLSWQTNPLWFMIVSLAATVPAGMLGGRIARKQ